MADRSTGERARTAFQQHEWPEAYEAYSLLAQQVDVTPEDLERLGESAWWSAHPAESIEAFEHAYAAHEAAGHERSAAMVALRLAMEHADRLETARCNAWVQRAVSSRSACSIASRSATIAADRSCPAAS